MLIATLLGCGSATKPTDAPRARTKPVVFATNGPLGEIARRLAGDAFEVVTPVPDGVDATTWQPSDEQVRAMQDADAILLNGAHFEQWTRRVSLPERLLADTSWGFRKRYVVVEDFSVHTHGAQGEHSHPGTAPNTYLDPALALEQAAVVRDTLRKLGPSETKAINERFESLADELQTIEAAYAALPRGDGPTPVFASHPFCNYAARRANWEVVHLHWTPDAMPSDADWKRLGERLEEHAARWMLWDREPLPAIAERLKSLGIESVVLDSGTRHAADRDLATVLRGNLATVRRVNGA